MSPTSLIESDRHTARYIRGCIATCRLILRGAHVYPLKPLAQPTIGWWLDEKENLRIARKRLREWGREAHSDAD
jgi:hypothetical protein